MTGRKVLLFSGQAFVSMFAEGSVQRFEVLEGLPSDARFIAMDYWPFTDLYRLVYESDTWEPVPEGAELEPIAIVVRISEHAIGNIRELPR